MQEIKSKIFPLILSVLAVNAAGFLLLFYELDNYIIVLGFRFHLSLTLPFILIFRRKYTLFFKKILSSPDIKKHTLLFAITVLPIIFTGSITYFLSYSSLGEPEYFYELGLSSIIDFPLYLAWNFPQLLMLILFLYIASETSKAKFLTVFLSAFLIFGYYLIPLGGQNFNYIIAISFMLSSIILAVLIKFYKNIYWIAAIIFFNLWSIVLLFGSKDEGLINILLAGNYYEWDGHLELIKPLNEYLFPGFFLILLGFLLIFSLSVKTKS